jgi:hypothetical protein
LYTPRRIAKKTATFKLPLLKGAFAAFTSFPLINIGKTLKAAAVPAPIKNPSIALSAAQFKKDLYTDDVST